MPKKIDCKAIDEHCPNCGTFLFEYVKEGFGKVIKCITCPYEKVEENNNESA